MVGLICQAVNTVCVSGMGPVEIPQLSLHCRDQEEREGGRE